MAHIWSHSNKHTTSYAPDSIWKSEYVRHKFRETLRPFCLTRHSYKNGLYALYMLIESHCVSEYSSLGHFVSVEYDSSTYTHIRITVEAVQHSYHYNIPPLDDLPKLEWKCRYFVDFCYSILWYMNRRGWNWIEVHVCGGKIGWIGKEWKEDPNGSWTKGSIVYNACFPKLDIEMVMNDLNKWFCTFSKPTRATTHVRRAKNGQNRCNSKRDASFCTFHCLV